MDRDEGGGTRTVAGVGEEDAISACTSDRSLICCARLILLELGPKNKVSALFLSMGPVAREVCMAAGSYQTTNPDV